MATWRPEGGVSEENSRYYSRSRSRRALGKNFKHGFTSAASDGSTYSTRTAKEVTPCGAARRGAVCLAALRAGVVITTPTNSLRDILKERD